MLLVFAWEEEVTVRLGCRTAARGKVCLLILSYQSAHSLHEPVCSALGTQREFCAKKTPFRCLGCLFTVSNVVGCTELDQCFP